jgi:thiamine-phosphate diphosphorylase
MTLITQTLTMKIKGLYFITIENKQNSHVDLAKKVLNAGCKIIQYREKEKSLKDKRSDCLIIKKLCDEHNALFIVNDDAALAAYVEADGVHLGQFDENIENAKIIVPDKIIGVSASTVEEAVIAGNEGAHYLGVGPVFPTPTKSDAVPPIGLENLSAICDATDLPVIAIGGIDKNNAREVYKAGARGIAVISAVTSSGNIDKATKELLEISEPFTKN